MRCPGDCEFCTIDSLRAELAELRASRRWEYIEALEDRAEKAEAALARARELCAEIGTKPYWNKADSVAAILSALVGAE